MFNINIASNIISFQTASVLIKQPKAAGFACFFVFEALCLLITSIFIMAVKNQASPVFQVVIAAKAEQTSSVFFVPVIPVKKGIHF
jgi:hypothetical protein